MEIEKSGTITTSVTVAVWVRVPSVPLMVRVYEPAGVLLLVVTVIVEAGKLGGPDVVGLKEAVAPAGRPLALNVTVPLYPLNGVTVAV